MTKKQYKSYSKKQFEYLLRGVAWKVHAKEMRDVTEDLNRNGMHINEHVYLLKTHREPVSILIYSSVDVTTATTRELGADAVRVVVTVKTPKGRYYKSMRKHLRIETLFDNLHTTLAHVMKDINYDKYSPKTSLKGFKAGVGV